MKVKGGKKGKTPEMRARRVARTESKIRRMGQVLRRRTAAVLLDPKYDQASSDGSVDDEKGDPVKRLRDELHLDDNVDSPEGNDVGVTIAPAPRNPPPVLPDETFASGNVLCTHVEPSDTVARSSVVRHILQHVAKRRRAVKAGNAMAGEDNDAPPPRDSGYTPCTVLVILPMRNACHRFVSQLVEGISNVVNRDKFDAEFGIDGEADPSFIKRPLDHQAVFSGNVDDKFCIGIALPGKAKAVLYAKYVTCDILVASPLGLCHYLGIGAEEDAADDDDDDGAPVKDSKSYLVASVEVLFVESLEVLFMQNWQRTLDVIRAINGDVVMTNTASLGDFARLRPHFLEPGGNGAAKHRQNIFLSAFTHPYFLSVFREVCKGSVWPHFTSQVAASDVAPSLECLHSPQSLRQYFIRIRETSLATAHSERLEYFKTKFYPTKLAHYVTANIPTILVVSSYFDYVALRAFFEDTMSESYSELCEYTPQRDRRSALHDFTEGRRTMLLMTERYYYFRRHYVKGAVVVAFYGPPLFGHFYAEIVNKMNIRDPSACVMTLFSRYDAHSALRVVGEQRLGTFLGGDDDATTVFMIA